MSKTYKVTGINLKTQDFGESDRIVTILTPELGLIRVVAPRARKHLSTLRGRCGIFVVNELLISRGRSIDRIAQAQTIASYPGLAENLGKLLAGQYLTELVLFQALSEQPQVEIYILLNEHLSRLQGLSGVRTTMILAYLSHGIYQLLAFAGLAPQLRTCCITHHQLIPELILNPHWHVGFSINSGGTICLQAWENLKAQASKKSSKIEGHGVTHKEDLNPLKYETMINPLEVPKISYRLNAKQLSQFQRLLQPEVMPEYIARDDNWLLVEKILRQYTEYHFGYPIRSAALIDSYFAPEL
ncbi:DNA recombination and repair protein RecO [Richelia intracellularis HM01]|uniref:DNA repair protein RecO n=1 Tax=Richelia intracellularis TaxID=1164990 RepID=UPI0002B54650|nr:DNA repair protein RecO [Richelia intracellularis]CCH65596.1 DNA recombination and repair protein RecO [Richelia intracellularis HM01]